MTVETLFVVICFISLSLKIYIYIWDIRNRGGILQSKNPSKKWEEYLLNKNEKKIN
jgi:hypothetical protein